MGQTIIGIIGPGERVNASDRENAHMTGRLAAREGLTVMTDRLPGGEYKQLCAEQREAVELIKRHVSN